MIIKCSKCGHEWDEEKEGLFWMQERRSGINPYESALANGGSGFTEPKLACPKCRQYLENLPKGEICRKINQCPKIERLMDQDIPEIFLADAIRKVCGECDAFI